MDKSTNPQPLLDEIFSESTPPDFRRATFESALRAARARRRRGNATRGLALVALVAAVVAPWLRARRSTDGGNFKSSTVHFVVSKPSASIRIVQTRLGVARILATSAGSCRTIETAEAKLSPRPLNDDQLLALFPSRPVALVRVDPPAAQLLFLDDPELESRR